MLKFSRCKLRLNLIHLNKINPKNSHQKPKYTNNEFNKFKNYSLFRNKMVLYILLLIR